MPETWCDLAVLRLKTIRNAGRELTEEEESSLPGCPWAIDSQSAHYCFFKYLSEFTQDKAVSDIELAALLNVSVDSIKKIEKTGLSKMRESETFSSMKSGDEQVVEESSPEDYKIYR
jgi:DNA-directed RNA polymerase sigma subunit (sigma70/sigma32)